MLIPPLEILFNDTSREKNGKEYFAGRLLCFDPGETTGYAVFVANGANKPVLEESGQLATKDVSDAFAILSQTFERVRPDWVVYENYLVYAWKAQDHSFSELVTPKVIGAIQIICGIRKMGYDTQMAGQAKGFVTDDKLKSWGLWKRGERHARDAIRHGIYWLLFTRFSKLQPNTAKEK